MKRFKKKNLKNLNVRYRKSLIDTNFNLLLRNRKFFVKNQFRNNLFFIRQLKKKLGLPSLTFLKKFKKKNFNLNTFLKKYFMRLDIILVNAGFFKTLYEARQVISHKKVCVNQDVVTYANFFLKKGDIITLKEKSFLNETPKKIHYNAFYFEANYKILSIVMLTSFVPQSDLILKLNRYEWLTLKNRRFF